MSFGQASRYLGSIYCSHKFAGSRMCPSESITWYSIACPSSVLFYCFIDSLFSLRHFPCAAYHTSRADAVAARTTPGCKRLIPLVANFDTKQQNLTFASESLHDNLAPVRQTFIKSRVRYVASNTANCLDRTRTGSGRR